ncbi:hypothetical protein POSPLADRAFT_1075257 [Postia placenta MAD-698-R-SB12]|uniref:Protein kinase domain-containing protein n=1 Tax=Postia placenta MAD-698-R-SB12 TaxID=670580 RepID=A0A1X6MTE5_9APHY|nr:hypothetical protein POSPLADRAFT_1075257 [Postia placenta MAD-698-R-SB12]OSX59648.1 hypothetical protein POSPLADRAFT_1075257 [Postia placenta MAD-698-R-SB12]
MIPPPQPPEEVTDIFSLTDEALANKYQFIEEIGFGNWGSVWLCRPRHHPDASSSDQLLSLHNNKIAAKLVHRSKKTTTTGARVRSLWNEMKVVRQFRQDPHPSIIPFHEFIITPSYAMITMAYHPRLVPVEVPEHHARQWFRSLLSGVDFIHKRGVVHNDIKPANILLSHENIPVLVDFGFAERYDVNSCKAFHSNLSYGTPEYLSPERARGLPHDTRKSDVWSLGVTFFEILVGRTPFEHAEGEQFTTKEELEKYWNRTLRGKWVGTWKMTRDAEKLLRRMILPNADLRCMASEALLDGYWSPELLAPSHRKATSVSHAPSLSLGLEKDVFKFSDLIAPWSPRKTDKGKEKDNSKVEIVAKPTPTPATDEAQSRPVFKPTHDKENAAADAKAVTERDSKKLDHRTSLIRSNHARSQSQSKLPLLESQARKNIVTPSMLATLSPVKQSPAAASPIVVSSSSDGKENASPAINSKNTRAPRRPLGPRSPTPPTSPAAPLASKENAPLQPFNAVKVREREKEKQARRGRPFKDVTSASRNVAEGVSGIPRRVEKPQVQSNSVRDRMREWERERARLREMELIKERTKEVEEERERAQREREAEVARELEREKEAERRREWECQLQLEAERRRQEELEAVRQQELQKERARALHQVQDRLRLQQSDSDGIYARIAPRRGSSVTPPDSAPLTPLSPLKEEPSEISAAVECEYPPVGNESGISIFKHGLRMSIDKTLRLYKSSTMALGRSTPALILPEGDDDNLSRKSISARASWEDDVLVRKANSSLPMVRHAVRNEELAAANQLDRMTLWARNVEKVVEDARQTFAASSSSTDPAPPLPLAPVSRRASLTQANRSARVPRKILAANHIFADGYESGIMDQTMSSSNGASVDYAEQSRILDAIANATLPTIPSEPPSLALDPQSPLVPSTPSRKRRATVVTRSPESKAKRNSLTIDTASPSKRREKSKSQNDLARPITPVTKLEFELERLALPTRPKRLSAVVDRGLFIASPPSTPLPDIEIITEDVKNELTESPFQVEPYPPRAELSNSVNMLDTPERKHLDDIYDRFLMSTAGVKRVGKGYQSNNNRPMSNVSRDAISASKRNQRFFLSNRKPMPPPVSSEDLRRASSVDEFGVVVHSIVDNSTNNHDQGKNTVAIVRKAFKAIVSGKPMTVRS